MHAAGVPVGGAEAWADGFLRSVAAIVPMETDGAGNWSLDHDLRASLSGEREFRRRMGGFGGGAPPSPFGRLRSMVRDLSRICGIPVDFRAWAERSYRGGPAPADLFARGDARFAEIERSVAALVASARLGMAPGDDAGLPFDAELCRRAAERSALLERLLGAGVDAARRELAADVLSHPAVVTLGVDWASDACGHADASGWLTAATAGVGVASRMQRELSVRLWAQPSGVGSGLTPDMPNRPGPLPDLRTDPA